MLEEGVALDVGVTLLCVELSTFGPTIHIGENTYVNRYSIFDASISLRVGANCMIGPHCYLTDHDHGVQAGALVRELPLVGAATQIGDNVWVGAGATILKGVTIGDNAVVGAGAVVTKSVPPSVTVAGVPAKAVKGKTDQ
jgi:acetyltransferase-like isoleucine patch superfamily enzyme